MDIHNYKGRYEKTLRRIKQDLELSKENKDVILKFKDYCLSEGIGIAKIERYMFDAVKSQECLENRSQKQIKRI